MDKKEHGFCSTDPLDTNNVVSEYEVVVCSKMHDIELYRVQFPQRKLKTFDSSVQPRIRYKKNVKLMEVRLTPNSQSGSFNTTQFADGCNSEKFDKSNPKLDELYEGRSFGDSVHIQNVAGCFQNGIFYICPVVGTFNMQRVLSHMNKAGGQKIVEDGEESDTEPIGQQLRVRFSRPETERQKKRREESAQHREKMIASDQWIGMHVHPEGDVISLSVLSKLLSPIIPIDGSSESSWHYSIRELVQRAILGTNSNHLDILCSNRLALSHKTIKGLTLDRQIKALMSKAHVITTESLLRILSIDYLSRSVLSTLDECSYLVRGAWVLKSTYLFNNLPPAHSNVPGRIDERRSKLWRKARDFSLCLIEFGHPLSSATLNRCFNLRSADAVEILSTFCIRADGKWKFKVEEDPHFLNRAVNLHLISKAKKEWVRLYAEFRAEF